MGRHKLPDHYRSNEPSDGLQVPFLVVEESIDHSILGLKAVNILVRNTRKIETLIAALHRML